MKEFIFQFVMTHDPILTVLICLAIGISLATLLAFYKSKEKSICNVCHKPKAIGVACVPLVPVSVAYCRECLEANSHPMDVLIANTVCIGGLEHANEFWRQMVTDSLKHQGKTLEWFNGEVAKGLQEEKEDGNTQRQNSE